MSRLRSGSLPTSPRVGGKGGPRGVGSLAAAVAAVMQQQQQWPAAAGGGRRGSSKPAMARKPSGTLQQLQGELADSDSDDASYSEDQSGECNRCDRNSNVPVSNSLWCCTLVKAAATVVLGTNCGT